MTASNGSKQTKKPATMKTILDYRKESILSKKIRFAEGVMTRKEWLNLKRIQGASVEEESRRNYAAEEKLKQWVYDNRDDNSGNSNWPPTKNWLAKKKESEGKIYKIVYLLKTGEDSGFYEITKTEYDYFQNKQLEEDLNTEKHDLSERIEAGIASEEEIQEDMNKEMEMFAKYFHD